MNTQTHERTKPSFESSYMFLKKIDALPAGDSASWKVEVLEAVGDRVGEDGLPKKERIELWLRDAAECVKELMGNSLFRDSLSYAPERHYADEEGRDRLYENTCTGNWWWDIQVSNRSSLIDMGAHWQLETYKT